MGYVGWEGCMSLCSWDMHVVWVGRGTWVVWVCELRGGGL